MKPSVLSFIKVRQWRPMYAVPFLPILSGISPWNYFGYFCLVVLVFWVITLFVSEKIGIIKENKWGIAALVAMLGVALVETIYSVQAMAQFVQISLIALMVRVMPEVTISNRTAITVGWLCMVLTVVAIPLIYLGTSFIFSNPNLFGLVSTVWGAALLKFGVRFQRYFGVVLVACVVYISESRSSFISMAVMIFYYMIGHIEMNIFWRRIVSLVSLVLPLVIFIALMNEVLSDLVAFIPSSEGKSGLSGRDVIWFELVDAVSKHDWRGFGLGSLPGDLFPGHYEGLSAHNGYLQILYQFGLVGFFIFFIFIALSFLGLARRDDGLLSVAILAAAVTHEAFEVALTQNHFGSGLAFWVLIFVNKESVVKSVK